MYLCLDLKNTCAPASDLFFIQVFVLFELINLTRHSFTTDT